MSSAPAVRHPADLPDLRLWLLDLWQPGRPFDTAARAAIDAAMRQPGGPHGLPTVPEWDREVLAHAKLWWVSSNLVDLLEAAAGQLPEDYVLTREHVPDDAGLVYLERPLWGRDAEPEGPGWVVDPDGRMGTTTALPGTVRVDAIAWGRSQLSDRRNAETCSIQSYRRFAMQDGLGPDELDRAFQSGGLTPVLEASTATDTQTTRDADGNPTILFTAEGLHFETWAWLGRTDWVYGDTVDAPVVPGLEPERAASQAEDRRWLAALWLLATQPNLVEPVERDPDRPTRRRSQRAGVEAKVRIIDLRRPQAAPGSPETDLERPEGQPGDVHWTRRWIVGGHWRNQAWGPGRRYRRPTWIAPYVKGPEDKPLKVRPAVKVVR